MHGNVLQKKTNTDFLNVVSVDKVNIITRTHTGSGGVVAPTVFILIKHKSI